MPDIYIERDHELPPDELRETVEKLAQDLQEKEGLEYGWEEDTLWLKRSGVAGRISVTPEKLTVAADLSMLFRPFRGRITQEIEAKLDELLA